MIARETLRNGIARLREAHVSSFTRDAELLLLHTLRRDRAWLYAHPEAAISEVDMERFSAFLARRANGEPTQHLTGTQEFWGLNFEVNPDVLIPRPETEHLIEVTLDRLALREVRAGRPQATDGAGIVIADIGTGSGCIAVALAKELPKARFYACDISQAALAVAQRNAAKHAVSDRIDFAHSNLLENARAGGRRPATFDAIVSNPPYIGRREADSLEREVRDHEPEAALYGGEEGYEFYGELIAQAAASLMSDGLLVLELGHNSLPAVQPLLEGPKWTRLNVTNDLAGIPRVIAVENLA